MTSQDFKTRKQDLVAQLHGVQQELYIERTLTTKQSAMIAELKTSNRDLAHASQMARCTCPCCADGCHACKKSLTAERKAAKVGV